jgi:hypothetical protein
VPVPRSRSGQNLVSLLPSQEPIAALVIVTFLQTLSVHGTSHYVDDGTDGDLAVLELP